MTTNAAMKVLFSGDTLTITNETGDKITVTLVYDHAEVRNRDGVILGGLYQNS